MVFLAEHAGERNTNETITNRDRKSRDAPTIRVKATDDSKRTMASLADYMRLPLEVRQQHLQTQTPCNGRDHISPKRLLSALGIEDDCGDWLKARVTIGYSCPHRCSNPAHAFLCRPDERRADHKERLRSRLAPYAASNLSDREVAKLASTSPATVAKYRKETGGASGIRLGKDGKLYARGAEAKAIKQLQSSLEIATQLLKPQRMTPEIRQLIAELSALANAK